MMSFNLKTATKEMGRYAAAAAFCMLGFASLTAQTIAEKKAGMAPSGGDLTRDMQTVLVQINKELREEHAALRSLYSQSLALYEHNAPESHYKDHLERINAVKSNIEKLENNWREMASETGQESGYALWHQPESTLGQLIIDYGSQNYVYIMPPEISSIKVSVDSNIPIPRASWNEMMEMILTQNGIGIKQLNPYLRQLYSIKQDKSGIALITNSRSDLEFLAPDMRIAFMLSPEPSDVRRIWAFLEKFVNTNSTALQMIGRDILIIAPIAEVLDMLKLYDFIAANKGDKEYRIRTVSRVDAEEMGKILAALFDQLQESPKTTEKTPDRGPGGGPGGGGQGGRGLIDISKDKRDNTQTDVNGLKIIPLTHIAQALFLVGTRDEIKKAEEIINQVEEQVGEARQKIIYQYTTKHTNAEDLAQILQKIYTLMIQTGTGRENEQARKIQETKNNIEQIQQDKLEASALQSPIYAPQLPNPALPSKLYQNDFYQQGGYVVNPAPIEPKTIQPQEVNKNRNNFIVDIKTGAIVMVVEADILPKMKDLIKKLDVPKKMVQIEALVFEKRLMRQDNFGLNLLRIGSAASNQNIASLIWNSIGTQISDNLSSADNAGIFDYIISRKGSHGVPAFDLAYRFLISQEDVMINANPIVVTLNQVPAKIAIVDEISINTGVFLVDTVKGITPENAFTRAQYGITIIVTPTIHMTDDGPAVSEPTSYVTLDTDITFDTVVPSGNQQPTVTRRHVTNQVSIPDGQTVVIGGLRRKNTDDVRDAIPYLGEIPGFGKLFSTTTLTENTLDLFIFLTPKIISDPVEDFDRLREEEMLKRPGDIPEFMCCLNEALEMEKNRLYAGTLNALFGRMPDRCVPEIEWKPSSSGAGSCLMGEFNGR